MSGRPEAWRYAESERWQVRLAGGLMVRAAAPVVLLLLALAGGGCAGRSRSAAETAGGQRQNESPEPGAAPTLKPKEGLSFRPRSFYDGVNAEPTVSGTVFEASDGERVESRWHSFKRRENAAKFYADELARARAVLEKSAADGETGVAAKERAVLEVVTPDGRAWAEVIEMRGGSVNEITGRSVGHVLAFERWQAAQK